MHPKPRKPMSLDGQIATYILLHGSPGLKSDEKSSGFVHEKYVTMYYFLTPGAKGTLKRRQRHSPDDCNGCRLRMYLNNYYHAMEKQT